jgi:hypothetical protein
MKRRDEMIKFETVTHWKRNEFDAAVTKYLNDGWKLEGGISVTVNLAGDVLYFVGMTKNISESA